MTDYSDMTVKQLHKELHRIKGELKKLYEDTYPCAATGSLISEYKLMKAMVKLELNAKNGWKQ